MYCKDYMTFPEKIKTRFQDYKAPYLYLISKNQYINPQTTVTKEN